MGCHCQMVRVAIALNPKTPKNLPSHLLRGFLAAAGRSGEDCLLAVGISLLDGVLTDTTLKGLLMGLRLGAVGFKACYYRC